LSESVIKDISRLNGTIRVTIYPYNGETLIT